MSRFLGAMILVAATCPLVAVGQVSSPAGADSLRSSITGTVRDSLGIPVRGASVIIVPGGTILRTDSAGRFVARSVQVGPLTVTIRKLGWSPLHSRVNAHAGELVLDLVMQRLPQMLAEVEVRADENRLCPRYSLDGILCRRETGRGQFMNRQDILATKAIFPMLVLRDVPGFRQNLNGDPRTVESIVGWRCVTMIVDGRKVSPIDPVPRVRDMFAVEVYQPPDIPPEYQHWYWRSRYPCTLVVFWSMRVGRQAVRAPSR